MKTINKCPLCGSKSLEQDFHHHTGSFRMGPLPLLALDGCHCKKCGAKNKFNKSGKCPRCDGTGIRSRPYSSACSTCKGTGKI